jgi:carboxyl-terminal processing protease
LKNDTLPKTPAKADSEVKDDDEKAAPAVAPQPGADNKATPATPTPLTDALKMGDPATDYQLARALDLLRGLSLYKGAAKAN